MQNLQNKLLEYYYQYKSYWPVVLGAVLVLVIFFTGASILINLNKPKPTPKIPAVQEVKIPEQTSVPQAKVETPKAETPKQEKKEESTKTLPKTGFPLFETTIALAALGIVGVKLFSFSGRSWSK